MLAENELEKLSVKREIFGNLFEYYDGYASPSSLTTWIDNLNSTGEIVNDWSL